MSPETIAILAVGIALFGTQITTFIFLLQRIERMNERISAVELNVANLRADMTSLETNLRADMAALDASLTGRMSTLELETKDGMANLRVNMTTSTSSLELRNN